MVSLFKCTQNSHNSKTCRPLHAVVDPTKSAVRRSLLDLPESPPYVTEKVEVLEGE